MSSLEVLRFVVRVVVRPLVAVLVCGALVPGVAVGAEVGEQFVSAGRHTATVEGSVKTGGKATGCAVDYVSEAEFDRAGWTAAAVSSCEPTVIPGSATASTVTATLSNLILNTKYRFRFELTSEGVSKFGPEGSFWTFGLEAFTFEAVNEAGEAVTRAGAHPYELRVGFLMSHTTVNGNPGVGATTTSVRPDGVVRDLLSELPPGLVGNPTAVPQCSIREAEEKRCSEASQIGELIVSHGSTGPSENVPLYNTVPPTGVAATFTAEVNAGTDGFIDSGVRTGQDYGITAGGYDISAFANVWAVEARLWGVPASSAHDKERTCVTSGKGKGCASGLAAEVPFLRMPTSCTGPMTVTGKLDSYEAPGEFAESSVQLPGMSDCSSVGFEPTVETTGTAPVSDSTTGLEVKVKLKQQEAPTGQATSDLQRATVTLPAGLTVNPASAAGLAGCGPGREEFGLTTPVGQTPIHTTAAPAKCPAASKIGSVEVLTPLLAHPLDGAVYLATPYENPFDSLLAIYIAVNDPLSGVVIKLAGHVEIGAEGQLTTTFAETPQLPFNEFRLKFFGGARSPLMTPSTCGAYATVASLAPWARPGSPVPLSWPVTIDQAPGGEPCPTSAAGEPNAPSFTAGSQSTQAGGYTPFVMHLDRADGSQRFSQITVTPPPGLLGRIAAVQQCPTVDIAAAEAATGTAEATHPSCPAGSEVGTVSVGAGAGPDPFYVTGHVYLAGPYAGAPFSFAIVTPALAGPFDLGTVVVRAGIYINPQTAQVTVKSAPIPTELQNIPLDIRSVNVDLSRPGFTLNPTNCAPMQVSGQELSTAGQAAALADHFQVGGCERLAFRPSFSATTGSKTSRKNGASLRVQLSFASTADENVASVKVALPKRLPSRDSTLELACPEAQFAADPAGCPEGSRVGAAKAVTPILASPLSGPVYFVSHAAAKFPELVAVLQGEGVTIDLAGETFISEDGITTSTFRNVPDAPVSSFEMTLPEASNSALAAPAGHLCRHHMTMPTTITAQDGKVVFQKTRITVTGCGHELHVIYHQLKGKTLLLRVAVPQAGRLTITGKGLAKTTKTASGTEALTVRVRIHKHHKQTTRLHLRFAPKHTPGRKHILHTNTDIALTSHPQHHKTGSHPTKK